MNEITINPKIEESWLRELKSEFESDYIKDIKRFLIEDRKHYTIYPRNKFVFNAFNSVPFDRVRVVILGQDPYHGAGQAHGLCFSVPDGIKPPPSLLNIYKELKRDLNIEPPPHGNLEAWTREGVFLLNSTLTVREHQAGSHQGIGWEKFTDAAIRALSLKREGIVFLLWGNFARRKKILIDSSKHLILEATHPSPFSVSGFEGCAHFSKTNRYFAERNEVLIDWTL